MMNIFHLPDKGYKPIHQCYVMNANVLTVNIGAKFLWTSGTFKASYSTLKYLDFLICISLVILPAYKSPGLVTPMQWSPLSGGLAGRGGV